MIELAMTGGELMLVGFVAGLGVGLGIEAIRLAFNKWVKP